MNTKYTYEQIKESSWTNVELGTTEGYMFPCGKTYPSEFFTKNEALESHNNDKCLMCESIDRKIKQDLRQIKNLALRQLIKEIRDIKERLETIVSITSLINVDGTQSEEYKSRSLELDQKIEELKRY